MAKYYVDANGIYLGEYADELLPPAGAVEVPAPPADDRQVWTGSEYAPVARQPADYTVAVQNALDAAAFAAGYDDIKSAVTYADEPSVPSFQAEGQAFRLWRSLCWQYCIDQHALVMTGQRTAPTVEELIAELPALVLPAEPELIE